MQKEYSASCIHWSWSKKDNKEQDRFVKDALYKLQNFGQERKIEDWTIKSENKGLMNEAGEKFYKHILLQPSSHNPC